MMMIGETTHGLSRHPLYQVWQNMIDRCYNKTHYKYHLYGARNIVVHPGWKNDVKEFIEWCENNGYKKGLQIDRIDNDLDYSPENCRFVTNKVNCRNQRRSKWWWLYGTRYESSTQAAIKLSVSQATIRRWCDGILNNGTFYPPKTNCYSELKYIAQPEQDE